MVSARGLVFGLIFLGAWHLYHLTPEQSQNLMKFAEEAKKQILNDPLYALERFCNSGTAKGIGCAILLKLLARYFQARADRHHAAADGAAEQMSGDASAPKASGSKSAERKAKAS